MDAVEYRYELWRRRELVATGRLASDDQARVGEPFTIGRSEGTVREVEPMLGQRAFRLVIDLNDG